MALSSKQFHFEQYKQHVGIGSTQVMLGITVVQYPTPSKTLADVQPSSAK
jgi:hypothetical protein